MARVRDRLRENWLLVVGVALVGAGLAVARELLVVYTRELLLETAAYVALQVAGWTAIAIWAIGARSGSDSKPRVDYEWHDVGGSDRTEWEWVAPRSDGGDRRERPDGS